MKCGFIIFVIVALIFASLASYARTEGVPGWIVPSGGLIRVAAREGGVVTSISVREGAVLHQGAPIASLRLSTDLKSGDSGQALTRDLSVEAGALAAQARAATAKLILQKHELEDRRVLLRGELTEVRARIAIMASRQALAERQVARGEALSAKGYMAPQTLDQLRATALASAQDTSLARAQALDLERQIGDLGNELAALPEDLAAAAAQAEQSRASLAQRRTSAETQSASVATAPIAGRVVAIPVEVGQTLQAGGAIAVMTPAGSPLTAELYVPSKAAGFIKPGQTVRLMYEAFPYQTFGTGRGTVIAVSDTVLAPSEIAIPGLTVREPVFRIRVKLDQAFVRAYRKAVPLQPGMLLTADVVIDRRSLLQWLLDPLYAAGRRA